MYIMLFHAHTDKLVVVLQTCSPKQLKHNEVLPIYCVASNHSLHLEYDWFRDEKEIGVCSPVLYVTMEGTYKCRVSDAKMRMCTSRDIEVISG